MLHLRSTSAPLPETLNHSSEAVFRRSTSYPPSPSHSPLSTPSPITRISRACPETDMKELKSTENTISRTTSLDVWLPNPCSDDHEVGGGGGGGGGRDGGDRCSGLDHGSEPIDKYNQKIIKANPENALLGNHAMFLREICGNDVKAQKYYRRAMANTHDGNMSPIHGELASWYVYKDANRARTYFDQAIKDAPDDCYVHAAYARFLWDTEEDEDEQEEETRKSRRNDSAPEP